MRCSMSHVFFNESCRCSISHALLNESCRCSLSCRCSMSCRCWMSGRCSMPIHIFFMQLHTKTINEGYFRYSICIGKAWYKTQKITEYVKSISLLLDVLIWIYTNEQWQEMWESWTICEIWCNILSLQGWILQLLIF